MWGNKYSKHSFRKTFRKKGMPSWWARQGNGKKNAPLSARLTL
ncbi:Hypothetical protein IALB_3033 [Ignavibacterium album JCM 16511]|uniref:Uncharacterized protein n=1 Tax=Ignavibacterium album (strain DSM 19864 / JCM 16511 / NBRC 101810 / Mat9-16) TaxID=945713 RepID=I0AP29_IGNAJ|nr:Hypothetical protein IALB_3033 [Ignavibacterium album JCM 16511]